MTELMWPITVANKLLRRPLAANNFVADFPSSDTTLTEPCSDHPTHAKRKKYYDQREIHTYKLFASTYNVGGVAPTDDIKLEDWLNTKSNFYDIYILGFQEIVPLNPKNVLCAGNKSVSLKWNSLIREALNRTVDCDGSHVSQDPNYPSKEDGTNRQGYRCIVSKQMVGISVSVWVRGSLACSVRHPSVSCVGCGFMGRLGNKGSVAVRFFLHDTSFCIVCCHLASGGKEGDEKHRNSDAMEIFSRTSFPRVPDPNLPRRILEHDRIILLGDLNYRISLSDAETRTLVEQKEWNILLKKDQVIVLYLKFSSEQGRPVLWGRLRSLPDHIRPRNCSKQRVFVQLRREFGKGRAFEGWHEGAIEFTPTYKYYPNSDEYYGCIQNKKDVKKRPPAWILYRGDDLKQISYDRSEYKLSDHRPVQSIFLVEVEAGPG